MRAFQLVDIRLRPMRHFYLLLALAFAAWASIFPGLPTDQLFMFWRRQGIQLTGIIAITLMGALMLMALRPRWLERRLGGLDHLFYVHKWCGISAGIAVLLHWTLVKLPGWLVDLGWLVLPPRAPRLPNPLRWWALHLGEWCFYAMVVFIIISLLRRIPYRHFRLIHRLGAVLFIMGALHSIYFIPSALLWSSAFSALVLLASVIGIVAALLSLSGYIRRKNRLNGKVVAVREASGNIVEIDLELEQPLAAYQPGQFAFLNLNPKEGDHPFSIATCSADRRHIGFTIKALGDYTRTLAHTVKAGDAVTVQGPYGGFVLAEPSGRECWLAGGVGIAPFLAWLEALAARGEQRTQTQLVYCVRSTSDAAFSDRLQELCGRTGVALRIVGSEQEGRLDLASLGLDTNTRVWLCGPHSLRKALAKWVPTTQLHYEHFEFR